MTVHTTVLEVSRPPTASADLVQLVRRALEQALAGESKLPAPVFKIPGMSGRRYRCFINNLIEQHPSRRYLEIGSWAGSTLCSAIWGNQVDALAIDNWSQFGGPSDKFFHNLAQFKGAARVTFLEKDFRHIDYSAIRRLHGPFGVYLFDGPHTFEDQYDGITIVQPALEPVYVQIIDDWNWPQVRAGTLKAISDLHLRIDFMAEIRTSLNDQHAPDPICEGSDWHNGYCISVLAA